MKLKNENYSLKSENLIKQQSLEKNALTQKMNSEFEEMVKVKQIEIDKIVTKYKNKKFELETRQGKEKNLHDNENLLKANIFNSNLTNFSHIETLHYSTSKFSKNSSKMIFNSNLQLKEIPSSGNRGKASLNLNTNGKKKAREGFVSSANANGSYEKNSSNKVFGNMNKSVKLFNIENNNNILSTKPKTAYVRNLQYSSAQN